MIHNTYEEPIVKIDNDKKEVKIILHEKLEEISTENIICLTEKEVNKILNNNKNKNLDSILNKIKLNYNNNLLKLKNLDTFKLSNIFTIVNDFIDIDEKLIDCKIEDNNFKSNELDNIINRMKMYLNMSYIINIFSKTKYIYKDNLKNSYKIMKRRYNSLYKNINSIKFEEKINNYKYELESYSYFKDDINICKLKDKDVNKFKKYINLLEIK